MAFNESINEFYSNWSSRDLSYSIEINNHETNAVNNIVTILFYH